MGDAEAWRWVWLLATVFFLVGEMLTPGSFFLLPFAAGALVAMIAAFAGAGLAVQWVIFIVVTAATSLAFIPLRNRLDEAEPGDGIGARRMINQQGVVLRAIAPGPDGVGMVRVGREEWRAESVNRAGIPEGAAVSVRDVRGTMLIVEPARPTTEGTTP